MRPAVLTALAFILGAAAATAQERSAGPVIRSAGEVYPVAAPDFETPTGQDYRVAFEVATPAARPGDTNASMNSVARFLNMHVQAGVPRERVHAAMVVHGGAGFELLDDDAYRERFGVDNPNGALLRELIAEGMPVILCGQTAASRGVPRDGLIPGVQVALSAMTAFVVLQQRGYVVNPW